MLDSQALRMDAKHLFRYIEYRKTKKTSQHSRYSEVLVDMYQV